MEHHKVSLGVKDLSKYRLVVESELIDEVEGLARDLKGLRICHINSTPFGGGVAELLVSYIPLVRSLGIQADWQVILGDQQFFTLTKCVHNAMQGGECSLLKQKENQRSYETTNLHNARELDLNYDILIINDLQPAALRHFSNNTQAKWVWRCHVDSSQPDDEAWDFLRHYVQEYDVAVFTMEDFVPPDLKGPRIATLVPAIDAFSSKNMSIPRTLCREILENLGIDRTRPLITQVSRFDPWKDPYGVIDAYRLAKKEIPGLQLAFVGSFAQDDPEAWEIYACIHEAANQDDDMYVFSNLTGVGNMEVNAFQTASDVVIQKSLKEGFGLIVSEALWKATPVVAGNAGGIPMQMAGNLGDYLISSPEECAEKVVHLLKNPELAQKLGEEGKEHVRRNFLMPRLIRDELRLVKSLVGGG